jgi:hypothetical protein
MGRAIVRISCPKCHRLVPADVIDTAAGPTYHATFPVKDPAVKIGHVDVARNRPAAGSGRDEPSWIHRRL